MARNGRLATKVAVIGPDASGFVTKAAGDRSLKIVGVYDDRAAPPPGAAAARSPVDDLVAYAQANPVDVIVLAMPPDAAERIAEIQSRVMGIAADVVLTADAGALTASGAPAAMLGNIRVVPLAHRPLKDWPAFMKAVLDRVISAVALFLLLPLLTAIALLIKLDSPGPVLFRQGREGLNGAIFTMFKFRTMVHRRSQDEWIQASRGDRRVTAVGRYLRSRSLDELPQLLNVLLGDMSLVGPRPHLPTTRAGDELLRDIVPDYPARHRVKPGLTGWAQVNGLRGETRTRQQVSDRIAHDLYYIENWSFRLDLRILAATLLSEVFSRSGNAY